MLIISFREPSACIAKTDIRVYRVTMVNLLFYDSRVLLFTIILLRSAFFRGNNMIVKYHLIRVRDCLFYVALSDDEERKKTQLICAPNRGNGFFFCFARCLSRQRAIRKLSQQWRENYVTMEAMWCDIKISFHEQTFFSAHVWSGWKHMTLICGSSLQINKLDWTNRSRAQIEFSALVAGETALSFYDSTSPTSICVKTFN